MTTKTTETATFPAWVIAALNGTATRAVERAQATEPQAVEGSIIEPANVEPAPADAPAKGKGKRKGKRSAVAVDPETVINPAAIELPTLECHSLPDCSAGSVQVDTLT
jgi:hypothetical protein